MKTIGKTLILLAVVLLILQSFLGVYLTYKTVDKYEMAIKPTTARATGVVQFCINAPPVLNTSNCSHTATQDVLYECRLNYTDSNFANITFSSLFLVVNRTFNTSTADIFSVSSDGNISFTPTNNDVGNHSVRFRVDDGYGCDNSFDDEIFILDIINVNDPPIFIANISDISFNEVGDAMVFYLDNHFIDIDLDHLNYSASYTSSAFSISINQLTSAVSVSASECDVTGFAMFTAIDPYNATNTSNLVRITCVTSATNIPSDGGTGSGGGGSAGFTEPCIPEYSCYDYHRCNISNVKVQKCIDQHGCEDPVFLEVPCTYNPEIDCNETWNCSEWESCLPNSTQYRSCTDLNDCGTKEDIPDLVRACTYIGTCEDGIKNCHSGGCEEGVDCGGPCLSCKSIDVPFPFEEQKDIILYIITGIILLCLTAVLLYHYFRKEINAALAKAGWIISKKRRKQILINEEDKKKLLAGLLEVERKFGSIELFDTLNKYAELIRYYFIKVSKDELKPEFNLADFNQAIEKKKKIREILRKTFLAFFTKYLKVEQTKELITKRNILLLIEELRNIVLQTSKTTPEDSARELKEFNIPEKAEPAEKMLISIINAYIALQFLELGVAKKKYLDMLTEYEKLSVPDQEAIYEDIARLYHNISYVNSWRGSVKK